MVIHMYKNQTVVVCGASTVRVQTARSITQVTCRHCIALSRTTRVTRRR